MSRRDLRIIGHNGNLWDNETTSPGDISKEFDMLNYPHISIIVNAQSDVTINFQVSPDGENWTYCEQISEQLPQGGSSEAHFYESIGAKYCRLERDPDDAGDINITATIQAKP